MDKKERLENLRALLRMAEAHYQMQGNFGDTIWPGSANVAMYMREHPDTVNADVLNAIALTMHLHPYAAREAISRAVHIPLAEAQEEINAALTTL